MSDKSVATRLAIKPGHAVRVMGAPPQFSKVLGRLPATARITQSGPADRMVLFVSDAKELDRTVKEAMAATRPDGALWIAYPKLTSGKSDLSRQTIHDKFRLLGWKPVGVIAIDDVWTAIRGRPATEAERRRI